MKYLILTILLPLMSHADQYCDWAVQVQKDAPHKVAEFNAKISALNQQIQAEVALIDSQLTPRLNDVTSELGVYESSAQIVQRSQIGIKNALLFIQSTIVTNKGLKIALNQLKQVVQLTPSRSLADQIHEATANMNLSQSSKDKLNELANAVALLETTQADWQESEKQLLKSYLAGATDFAGALYNELTQLNESLTASLKNLNAGHDSDKVKLKSITDDIAAAQQRIANENNQIEAEQQNIINYQGYVRQWSPTNHCPAPEPVQREPMCMRTGFCT